ncbi:DNA-binding transcriptional regulator, MarR family [Geosporobacter subterraneus DSM 17957]|uniref:DNA-binding transcriptional regulator, MarR family n=1 Tax=Geosporobacter subterraneus DSM 17957 TaxID=1121919 RepID=A0A1M6KVK2_9FIRM|nr:MarR family transcriptional regulator [Geosporobacter subterraneus]SHJ62969.1 DNA-binding transcriptional regulator, MarR family [Geosporobacter subterraneus DSM 17957]
MNKKNIVENHRFVHILKGLYKSMEREWDIQAQQYDLTNAHQHVLWILYLEDGMKLSELAARGLWNLSTTHDIVNRMVKKGLITKEKDIRDGRITRVYITELGIQQRNAMKSDFEKSEVFRLMKAFHKLEEHDQKKLQELILFLSEEVLDAAYMKYLESSSQQLEAESK